MGDVRVVVISDSRRGYDDGAALAAVAAQRCGADVTRVMLVGVGGVARGQHGDNGGAYVRVPAPGPVAEPQAGALKALDDVLTGLTLRRRALDATGAGPRSVARLRLVAEIKAMQRLREQVAERPLAEAAVLRELAQIDAAATALVREVSSLSPTLVIACGPEALAAAARCGVDVIASPRTEHAPDEARVAAVAERARTSATRVLAMVPEGADHGCWEVVLSAAGFHPIQAPDEDRVIESSARLLIGPAGFAGQAWEWGQALRRETRTRVAMVDVVTVEQTGLNFPADLRPTPQQWDDLGWQLGHIPRVLSSTHVLSESLRPVLGLLNGSAITGDLPALRRAGISVAVVLHGSEVRDPRLHGSLYEHAPFGPEFADVPVLQDLADRNARILAGFHGPIFVSTPDLLDSVPHARWLPVVVGPEHFTPAPAVLQRTVPVVLHAPSNPRFKGTVEIQHVFDELAAEGLIDYHREGTADPSRMPELLREADIVVDHVVIGNYGVLAAQAMAAGRLVVGHVHERVRRRLPRPLPMLEATAHTLEAVLREALTDRDPARALAAQGPDYVADVHDGRRSAAVLSEWLGRA